MILVFLEKLSYNHTINYFVHYLLMTVFMYKFQCLKIHRILIEIPNIINHDRKVSFDVFLSKGILICVLFLTLDPPTQTVHHQEINFGKIPVSVIPKSRTIYRVRSPDLHRFGDYLSRISRKILNF